MVSLGLEIQARQKEAPPLLLIAPTPYHQEKRKGLQWLEPHLRGLPEGPPSPGRPITVTALVRQPQPGRSCSSRVGRLGAQDRRAASSSCPAVFSRSLAWRVLGTRAS